MPSKLSIGYRAFGTDAMQFTLPPGTQVDSGFLKVFVSTVYGISQARISARNAAASFKDNRAGIQSRLGCMDIHAHGHRSKQLVL
jgi:hypothetical protein